MSTADPATAMPAERRFPATLLLFGVLSFFAHAATFFLFQVGYPSHVTMPLQTPQVSLLTGDTPEQLALLRWVESEDPALTAAGAHPVPERLFETPYVPSYMTLRTAPRSMPVRREQPVRAPGPELSVLLRSLTPSAASVAPKVESAPTRVLLSGGLTGRALAAPLVFKTAAAGPLEDASALLGVTPEGEVRFLFLQRSSGDHPTDADALAQLAQARFVSVPGVPEEIAWGFASVVWGDDAYPPAPR